MFLIEKILKQIKIVYNEMSYLSGMKEESYEI